MFTCTFETDSAAFDETPGEEAARILREIADRIENETARRAEGVTRDINGNKVGSFVFDILAHVEI